MAIAFVEKLIGQAQTLTGTPTTFTSNALTNAASVGDLVVVNVYTGNNVDAGGMTISDSSGNTWTKELSNSANSQRALQAYSILTTALTTASTFTIGGLNSNSNKRIVIIAAAFSGVSAVDISGTYGHSSGTGTLTTASDLMVTFSGTSGNTSTTVTPASGFTEVADIAHETTGNITLEMAFYVNAFTAGSYTYTPTYNSDADTAYRRTRYLTFTEIAAINITINATTSNTSVGGNTNALAGIASGLPGTPIKTKAIGDWTGDYARIASEGWTYTSSGGATPYYTTTDEGTLDLNDYIIFSGTIHSNDYWYISLPVNVTSNTYIVNPLTGKGHILRFAHQELAQGTKQNMGIWLYSGNTYIGQYGTGQDGMDVNVNGNPIITQITLPEADMLNITDYNDLYVLPFIIGSRTETINLRWHWFELEIPYWQGIGGLTTLTNITVGGQPATVSVADNITITAPNANVNVIGQAASVTVTTDKTISAVTSNITLNSTDSTVSVTSNVTVTSASNTISLLGHNASISLGTAINVTPELGLITITGKAATVTAETSKTISASTSSITLDAKNTSSSYYNTVVIDSPKHWWRMNNFNNPTVVTDQGSSPYNGVVNVSSGSYQGGIAGAWTDIGYESLLTNASTDTTIRFTSGLPIANLQNITLECWIQPNYNLETFPIFVNNMNDLPSSGTKRHAFLGLINGKIGKYSTFTYDGSQYESYITQGPELERYRWHHLVFTKSTSGSTSTYKSYVNGVLTETPISIGDWFAMTPLAYQSIGGSVNVTDNSVNGYLGTEQVWLDEIAVYDTALSAAKIYDHYLAGLNGLNNINITTTTSNTTIAGIAFGNQGIINANVSNIGITGKNPNLDITGNPTIITNAPNINIAAPAGTYNFGSNKTIYHNVSNISLLANNPKIKTQDVNFIFIDKSDISLSAIDALEIDLINFGGLLYNQVKKQLFKIGNTSDSIVTFIISVSSKEDLVASSVSLSIDNVNYSPTLTIENINPNQTTDNIYVKFDVNLLDVLGPGTFIIHVEQIYVN